MTETIKVKVTQADIDNGERNSCPGCPIALAIKRTLPRADRVLVFTDSVLVRESGYLDKEFSLPSKAEQFIHRFDYGVSPVEPFEFELTEE